MEDLKKIFSVETNWDVSFMIFLVKFLWAHWDHVDQRLLFKKYFDIGYELKIEMISLKWILIQSS